MKERHLSITTVRITGSRDTRRRSRRSGCRGGRILTKFDEVLSHPVVRKCVLEGEGGDESNVGAVKNVYRALVVIR